MQDIQDLTLYLLPRVKHLILNYEVSFKENIREWAAQKKFVPRFIVGSLINPMWSLIIGPLLPVIIKLVVNIVIGTAAPILIPLIPLINQIIDYIGNHILSEQDKVLFKQVLQVVKNFNPDDNVKAALSLSPVMTTNIINDQEYFNTSLDRI